MKRYISTQLKPGGFLVHDDEPHRVDPDPKCGESLRDKLARCISDNYSDQPGRLCLTKVDYGAADDVMLLLFRLGITWN